MCRSSKLTIFRCFSLKGEKMDAKDDERKGATPLPPKNEGQEEGEKEGQDHKDDEFFRKLQKKAEARKTRKTDWTIACFFALIGLIGGVMFPQYYAEMQKSRGAQSFLAEAKQTVLPETPSTVEPATPSVSVASVARADKGLQSVVVLPQATNILAAATPAILPVSKGPAEKNHKDDITYVIKHGDTLTRIAKEHCSSVSALAQANGIKNPDRIYVGHTLSVSQSCSSSSTSPTKIANSVSPEKFAKRGGASQEKRIPEKRQPSIRAHASRQYTNCQKAGNKLRGNARTLAIAECIHFRYGASIRKAASQTGLSDRLITAVMLAESEGNPRAVSSSGCLGLMQLLASTALEYGVPKARIFHPDANILGGAHILEDYLKRYAKGDLDRALASYNIGPNGVARRIRQQHFDPAAYPYTIKVKRYLRLLEAQRERR